MHPYTAAIHADHRREELRRTADVRHLHATLPDTVHGRPAHHAAATARRHVGLLVVSAGLRLAGPEGGRGTQLLHGAARS